MTTLEGVLLPVGGIILEVIHSARVPLGENHAHLLDKRQWRHWHRYLLGGVVGGDNGRLAGGLTGRLDEGGELKGGCRARAAATKIILAAGGGHKDVGSCYLQRTMAVDIAWQLLVRRGTVSEDGACDTIIVGRLGLQRTAAGCSALVDNSGVVLRRKMAQVTT